MSELTAQNEQTSKRSVQKTTLRYIVLLFLLLFLVVYLISVIYTASDFFEESASSNALVHLSGDVKAVDELVQLHYDNLQSVADQLALLETKDEVDALLASYIGGPTFGTLRYYADTHAYDSNGVLVTGEVNTELDALAAARRQGAVIYFDSVVQQDCVAFFLPVGRESYADSVLSVVPIRDRETGALLLDLSGVLAEDSSALALIGPNDRILLAATADDFGMIGNDVQSFLSDFTASKHNAAAVIGALQSGAWYSEAVQAVDGVQYSISCAPVESLGSRAMLVGVNKNEVLVAGEMIFIRHMIVLLVISGLAFVALLIYSILYHRQAKKALSTAMLTDASLECPNVEQFRRNVIETVYSQKRPFAVLYYQLKRHHHIVETLGDQKANEIFRFVAKVFETFGVPGEAYGYAGDGNFLVLTHYQSDKKLGEKVRLMEAVINKSELVKGSGVAIKYTVGVYLTTQGRRTVPQMIECAMMAVKSTTANKMLPYMMYTEAVKEEISNNERIEAQMEEALSNGEFKLFLQPKYNVRRDSIDSAEALVRWFDPTTGEYRFPASFINLFETNGFIVKLDHFIYLEVLQYMSHAAERGEKIVPISVNVSRVSAMEDGFLDFYIGNKKKYQIGDGFLTLELTESFAMENYEKMLDIVNRLHENGIRSSIDDFGTGYSSFNTIKQIPIDELKIDRLFLEQGLDRERDDKIIQTVVQLAKSINVDIVQEGVENQEMFQRVVNMGIDIVQGYYYAKAISLEEYRIFLNSNTSIKYKAMVK